MAAAGNHHHTNHCDDGSCERLNAEGEVAVARLILDSGDLVHAAKHVGGAVGADPALPEAYEVLAELVAEAGGAQSALDLFPQSVTYAGSHACRAAVLAAVGRTSEAVFLLGAIIGAVPDLPWASVAWLEALATPAAAAALDPAQVGTALAHVTQAIGDPAPEPTRSYVAPYYALVREVVAQHPEQKAMVCMASSLARRMDDLDTAIAWAKTAVDIRYGPDRDALGAAMLGSALRRAGRVEEAIDVLQKVVRADWSQSTLAVELAELLGSADRPAEGIAVLERVLKSAPNHEKAAPAILALRYRLDADAAHLVALHDHLRHNPGHGYAGHLLQQLCADKPWLGRDDYAGEATVKGVRQLMESDDPGTENRVGIRLSAMEAPSSVLTGRLVAPNFFVEHEKVHEPDPRLPTRPVHIQPWRFEETVPYPAVPAPSQKAADLAHELATHHWGTPAALYDHAAALAGLPLDDLIGLLVHPPSPVDAPWPDNLAAKYPDFWVRAVQVLACTGIAHYRTDQPWLTSDRRETLLDLLDGPEDWICEAAAMALVTVGWTHPETRADVAHHVTARYQAAAQAGRTRRVEILESLERLTKSCSWTAAGGAPAPRRKLFGRR
ncbi:tetratricopeptide (TPR) repeat protein [Catenulispora sp. MAP5-51]|uniref:tetratricopeptide repeat protein n=1 Tax=Catenulispora sp. MAP5-51 TaxID=3156298 RepID=UPI003518E072